MASFLRSAAPPRREWSLEEAALFAVRKEFELLKLLSTDKMALATARRLGFLFGQTQMQPQTPPAANAGGEREGLRRRRRCEAWRVAESQRLPPGRPIRGECGPVAAVNVELEQRLLNAAAVRHWRRAARAWLGAAPMTTACDAAAFDRGPCAPCAQAIAPTGARGTCQ
jgi:hypothetical protein